MRPTFKELGKDFVYFMQRSVVGPPGMSAEAATYYRGVFAKVYASDEWQQYMTKKSLRGGFLTGAALKEYWAREKAIHKTMLKDIGELGPEHFPSLIGVLASVLLAGISRTPLGE